MWNKAINHFRLALNGYPNDPFLLDGLGNLLISCPDTTLRNIKEAREYSERAFINYKSTYSTKISAGKVLVTAYAVMGDKKNASKYINLVINLAKERNVPLDYTYFETLKRQYNISK